MFDKPQPQNQQELDDQLNHEFYENYDVKYFSSKSIILGGLLTKQSQIQAVIGEGYEVGKIKVSGLDDDDLKWMSNYAKQELVINSYHSVESFFRLLFAHYENPFCPWLGVLEQNNPTDFKKRLKKIIDQKYFPKNHKEELASLVVGKRETYKDLSDELWSKNVDNVEDLVSRLAHYLYDTPDYNVFKHGATLFKTEFGFSFGDGGVLKEEKQDTFIYLGTDREKTETEIITTHFRAYKFMKWELAFAYTILSSHLLSNLISIKKAYLGYSDTVELYGFQTYDLNQLLESGVIVSTLKNPLITYRLPRNKKKT